MSGLTVYEKHIRIHNTVASLKGPFAILKEKITLSKTYCKTVIRLSLPQLMDYMTPIQEKTDLQSPWEELYYHIQEQRLRSKFYTLALRNKGVSNV